MAPSSSLHRHRPRRRRPSRRGSRRHRSTDRPCIPRGRRFGRSGSVPRERTVRTPGASGRRSSDRCARIPELRQRAEISKLLQRKSYIGEGSVVPGISLHIWTLYVPAVKYPDLRARGCRDRGGPFRCHPGRGPLEGGDQARRSRWRGSCSLDPVTFAGAGAPSAATPLVSARMLRLPVQLSPARLLWVKRTSRSERNVEEVENEARAGLLRDEQQRLRGLLDKQEIHEALMRYCRGIDRGDAGSGAFRISPGRHGQPYRARGTGRGADAPAPSHWRTI